MKMEFLDPNVVFPQGWLLKQLRVQAEGLNGNLDKVWKDVYDSKWLDGESEGWERFPYFLDGFIPLAYLLRDEDMIARAKKYVDALLAHQREDGCFYPRGEEGTGDIWSLFLILKVLIVYADCSGEGARVQESVERCLRFLDRRMDGDPPFHWAAARWYECLIPVLWLYRRKKEAWLVRLARRLKAHGLDYEDAIPLWDEVSDRWTYETHVVNISMALKCEALYAELTGEAVTGLAERMLDKLFIKHGTAYGHFTGDECLSGTSPSQGSELCGVVEAMYSYEWLSALTGDAKWGDLLESLAFNALPAAVSADMWTHQYDQQVNQIACTEFERKVFRTNNAQSNLFGLEPNFGCCTANFGQGFPKFALSAYMRRGDALAVLSPVPCKILFGEGNTVVCRSEYPFRQAFFLKAERETPVFVRVPHWTQPVCKEKFKIEEGWLSFILPAGREVEICFPMQPRMEKRPQNRNCLKYGALLFALPVAGKKEKMEYVKDGVERKFPYCDYSVLPVGEWRYAFADGTFEVCEQEYGLPFSRSKPPLTIKAGFVPVEWDWMEGHDLVASDLAGETRRGETVTLAMQPYGATYLRVTEMALIK